MDKFYGAKRSDGVGFVTTREYRRKFKLACVSNLTFGNEWDSCEGETLLECLDKALAWKFQVFEFDTAKELFTWLAENS